jgi:hypothetical protein
VPAWHLTLYDCTVHVDGAEAWVNLPTKPVIDRDKRHQRNAVTGKLEYVVAAKWDSQAVRDRFSKAVIELIRARHLSALDD